MSNPNEMKAFESIISISFYSWDMDLSEKPLASIHNRADCAPEVFLSALCRLAPAGPPFLSCHC